MNKNFTVGLVVVVVILVASAFYLISNNGSISIQNTEMASSTVSEKPTAPEVVTASVVTLSGTNAIVNGSVNPKGAVTEYWYEYGKTQALGSVTPSQKSGPTFVIFLATDYIPNIDKNSTYYFKLVAENEHGRTEGNTFSFKMKK